jgi:trigger factor
MEKEDLIEALATDLLERKALEVVLSTAEYEDFELPSVEEDVDQTAAVTEQAIPGQMSDPTAVAPSEEEAKTEE